MLDELLAFFRIQFLLPYVIILLIYIFSIEEIEKHNFYLKAIKQYYLEAPLSKRELVNFFIILPNVINLLFKIDTILPFLFFSIFLSNHIFAVSAVLVILYVLLQNSYKTAIYVIEERNELNFINKVIGRIFFLIISFFIVNKIFKIVVISIRSMKELFIGYNYSSVSSKFEESLRNLIPNTEIFLNISKNFYLSLLLFAFFINIFNYIIKINKLIGLEKVIVKKGYDISHLRIFKYINFSGIEKLLLRQILGVKNTFLFLADNSEIFVTYYLVYLVCNNVNNFYVKIYILLAFFIIGNSNIINSFVIKNIDFFRNHNDIPAIGYWKISEKGIVDLYKIKKGILEKITYPLAIEHVIISYVTAITICNNLYELIIYTMLHFVFFLILNKLIRFNSSLSTFMTPYVFARFYKLLKVSAISEYEFEMYNKIYNFYKFPLVVLTLLPLTLQIFVNIFNGMTLLFLIVCLGIYFLYIGREEELLLEKGQNEYEKINV
ncbi:hypothetical protein [Streptococcus saliviloxodontae]|uniref:Uncharacterized protein n=1 Tax=Streptococcus saliviloxodontae TaxID=1349416 RepID=A0ABS2PKS1_9STRE|nr:hypothetical protein [Streptococcus saliviloxodontae]MBM7636038.1 hypothetical protein [Streptococcus saliviloxodontae]